MEERYGFVPPPAYSYPPNSDELYPPLNPPHLPPHPTNPNSTTISNFNHPQSYAQGQAFRWVDSSVAAGTVPASAVEGGVDADGETIYVGRAFHEDDLIPAKIIPSKNEAYVALNGEEVPVEEYQVLCRKNLEWVPSHAGHVPPGAVQGGHQADGEVLYIGRAFHEGGQTVGKIHPSHGVCYVPFDGEEIACPDYETLVLR